MKEQFERKEMQNEVIVLNVDLFKAESWKGKEGFRDYIIKELKDNGLYKENLVFRGFDGKRIESVKKNGIDIGVLFASNETQLYDETGLSQSAIDFALTHDVGAISVYDADKLINVEPYTYMPKTDSTFKDALVAILNLN